MNVVDDGKTNNKKIKQRFYSKLDLFCIVAKAEGFGGTRTSCAVTTKQHFNQLTDRSAFVHNVLANSLKHVLLF